MFSFTVFFNFALVFVLGCKLNLDCYLDRIRLCDCCPEGFEDVFLLLYRSSIGIMSMFFVVFAVHVAFLVTSLCAGVAIVEAGIA